MFLTPELPGFNQPAMCNYPSSLVSQPSAVQSSSKLFTESLFFDIDTLELVNWTYSKLELPFGY